MIANVAWNATMQLKLKRQNGDLFPFRNRAFSCFLFLPTCPSDTARWLQLLREGSIGADRI